MDCDEAKAAVKDPSDVVVSEDLARAKDLVNKRDVSFVTDVSVVSSIQTETSQQIKSKRSSRRKVKAKAEVPEKDLVERVHLLDPMASLYQDVLSAAKKATLLRIVQVKAKENQVTAVPLPSMLQAVGEAVPAAFQRMHQQFICSSTGEIQMFRLIQTVLSPI